MSTSAADAEPAQSSPGDDSKYGGPSRSPCGPDDMIFIESRGLTQDEAAAKFNEPLSLFSARLTFYCPN